MQFRLRTLFWLVGVATIVMALFASFLRITEYPRLQQSGAQIVESLRTRRPNDVPPQTWDEATGWAITAYHNICFSDGHAPLNELKAFIHDAEIKFNGPVDLSTVDWVWARLAKTGPHGQQYRDRFEPQYRMVVYGKPMQ